MAPLAGSQTTLQGLIYAELKKNHPTIYPEIQAFPDQVKEADKMMKLVSTIAAPIILHIVAQAVVRGTCNGSTLSGPPPGPYGIVMQPVAGTIQ